MTSTRRFLYQLLNQKASGWLIICVATFSKLILAMVFSNYESDKSFYLLLAKNLAAGEGFTIPVALLNNPGITENIYFPSAFAPLYSVLAAPLLQLFPDNFYLVTLLIESISWLLFFIVVRKLLLRLAQDHFYTNLFLLFSGFFLYTVEFSSSYKDVPAIALLFAGVLRCITISQSTTRFSFIYYLLTAGLFLLPGLIKYTYQPFALIFPLTLVFIAFVKKQNSLLRHGAYTLFLAVLLLTLHYFHFLSLEKQTLVHHPDIYSQRWSMSTMGNDFIAGFFPENLQRMYPFIPATLVNLDMAAVQVKAQLPSAYRFYGVLFYTINFIGIAVLLTAFFYLLKRFYRKSFSDSIFFLLVGLASSFSLIALLSFMSIRYQAIEYKGGFSSWTYVYESGLFLFPLIFLQLCLFIFLFAKKQQTFFLRWLRVFLLLVAGISFLHAVYFRVKQIRQLKSPGPISISVNKLVTAEADSLQTANKGSVVWLATEMPHLDWFAKLHRQTVLNHLSFLNDSSFRLPPKTILLTAIAKDDTSFIRNYIGRPGVTLYRNYNDAVFLYLQKPGE